MVGEDGIEVTYDDYNNSDTEITYDEYKYNDKEEGLTEGRWYIYVDILNILIILYLLIKYCLQSLSSF